MGRRKGSGGDKPKKRKKVTVRIINEKHAGETTEPHKILAEICRKNHGHLDGVRIGLAWRSGWRADADGHTKLGQCRKSSDLDREMYAGFDFVILLNEEAWPALNAKQKQALIDHELCHAALSMDSNGEPKYNDRDRLVCRIKKHDVEEFRCIVERHGLYTQDLAAIATAAINDSKRPLLAEAEKTSGNGETSGKPSAAPGDPDVDDSWKKLSLAAGGFRDNHQDDMEAHGIHTLGELQDAMNKGGQFWAKNTGVNNRFRVAIEDCFNSYITRLQKEAKRAAKA